MEDKNLIDNMSSILETTFDNPESALEVYDPILPPTVEDTGELDIDVNYSRKNLKELIRNGNDAIKTLQRIAEDSRHPRAFEVLATLIKNMGDLNLSLIDIHRKKNDILPGSSKGSINVDKAIVFTGSTTELIRIIKENKND